VRWHSPPQVPASTSFIAGNAQVDDYVVRCASQAAATTAVDRHRDLAVDCADAVAARAGTSGSATATLGGAVPAAVNGYRVVAHFGSGNAAFEEYTAVLQWGDRVAYLGMRPSNGPTTLDIGWTDRVAAAAVNRMVEAEWAGVAVVALGRQRPDHSGHGTTTLEETDHDHATGTGRAAAR
jgi:hypothetical protein